MVCVNPPPVEDEKVPMYWDNSGTDYKNMSMQTIEFSKPVKVEKFQLKNFDNFLAFAQTLIVGTG